MRDGKLGQLLRVALVGKTTVTAVHRGPAFDGYPPCDGTHARIIIYLVLMAGNWLICAIA